MANVVFLLVVTGMCMAVDGNGRILGLAERLSRVLSLAMCVGGSCLAWVLIARGRGSERAFGIILVIFYAILLAPWVVR